MDELETQTFIINPAAPPTTRNTDPLKPFYRPQDAAKHFASAYGPVHCYAALNMRNNHLYTVTFFLSRAKTLILASCNCPARKVCKHIAGAWRLHAEVVEAGFLPAFELTESEEIDGE